jgi:hypothetical protein
MGNTKPGSASSRTTQQVFAYIWDTLEWRKVWQAVCLILAIGIAGALLCAGLALAAHVLGGPAAAWPVGITFGATVSYQAARRRRR